MTTTNATQTVNAISTNTNVLREAAKFASYEENKKALNMLHFHGNLMDVTDSYHLARMEFAYGSIEGEVLIEADVAKKLPANKCCTVSPDGITVYDCKGTAPFEYLAENGKIISTAPAYTDDDISNYPKVEQLLNKTDDGVSAIMLNPTYLADACSFVTKVFGKKERMKVEFQNETYKPVFITAESYEHKFTCIIMPIRFQ